MHPPHLLQHNNKDLEVLFVVVGTFRAMRFACESPSKHQAANQQAGLLNNKKLAKITDPASHRPSPS